MAKNEGKKSFIIYTSWITWLDALSLEQKGSWIDWVMKCCNDLNPTIPDDPAVKMCVLMSMDVLHTDLEKWRARCDANRENGLKGGRPKKETEENPKNQMGILETQQNQTKPKKPDNDNDIDNDIDIENEINNTCASAQRTESTKTDKFNHFWEVYPKKVGKQKCLNWFTRHSVSDELLTKMVNSVEEQKKSKRWTSGYIPDPYTWLNRGGWDDVLEENKFSSTPKDFPVFDELK